MTSTRPSQQQSSFAREMLMLAEQAEWEFSAIGDYVWKAPRLIDLEKEREKKKLECFPEHMAEAREFRRNFEFYRLENTFPYLIAMGNLFSVFSMFETYLMLLVGKVQERTSVSISGVSGNGVNRVFGYLRRLGIRPEESPIFEQISAAIKIRNCMHHANGMLDWSRDADELVRIQKAAIYLTREDRATRKEAGGEFDEVKIVNSVFGRRLAVKNDYCHLLTAYLRWYFIGLCSAAAEKLTEA